MNGRRILLALIVVAFVVVVSIAIFSIDWGGGNRPIQEALNKPKLIDYSETDVQVRMTVRGLIDSNQEHQDLVMTVGRDQTVGELMNGYQGQVSRTETTPSNGSAYKAFLSALQNSGFLNTQQANKDVQYDGACPTGKRYTFEVLNIEGGPASTWTASCGRKLGNFGGSLSEVRSLFEAQLPEEQFDALTKNTQF